MSEPITLEQEKKAVRTVQKWAGAGDEAYRTVQKIESAKLHGEPVELTKKEKQSLFTGALKMWLDGDISKKGKQALLDEGLLLDPNNLRKEIIEAIMPIALRKKISEGDIEGVIALGQLAGEPKAEQEIPQGAKKITRERIEIVIDD